MKNNTKNKLNNNIITIKIILHAYDNLFLNKFILNLKNKFKINFIKSFTSVNLPIKIKKYTVLSSPHVNKKAREQFETRFYKSIITIKTTKNWKKVKFLLQYCQYCTSGISLKILIL